MGLEYDYKEGQTPLDEEEKESLRIKTITSQKELNEFEQLNIEKAVEWTIQKNFTREIILTDKFVRDLHKKMFGDVWRWAGQFRKSNKNIGVNWTQIGVELKVLLDDMNYWIDTDSLSAEEMAIRFKHRIVSIHCFPNGNGRHSRLIADIIMESIFNKNIFTWHQSILESGDSIRKKYIAALRAADRGDIDPLIQFAIK